MEGPKWKPFVHKTPCEKHLLTLQKEAQSEYERYVEEAKHLEELEKAKVEFAKRVVDAIQSKLFLIKPPAILPDGELLKRHEEACAAMHVARAALLHAVGDHMSGDVVHLLSMGDECL